MRVPDCPDETSTTWRTGQESIKKPGPEAGPGSRDRHLDHGGPVKPTILLFPLGARGPREIRVTPSASHWNGSVDLPESRPPRWFPRSPRAVREVDDSTDPVTGSSRQLPLQRRAEPRYCPDLAVPRGTALRLRLDQGRGPAAAVLQQPERDLPRRPPGPAAHGP